MNRTKTIPPTMAARSTTEVITSKQVLYAKVHSIEKHHQKAKYDSKTRYRRKPRGPSMIFLLKSPVYLFESIVSFARSLHYGVNQSVSGERKSDESSDALRSSTEKPINIVVVHYGGLCR